MSALGDLFRKAREENGLTLRELAALTGGAVSNALISQIETGKVENPSLILAHRLTVALGLDFKQVAAAAMAGKAAAPAIETCPTCGRVLRPGEAP